MKDVKKPPGPNITKISFHFDNGRHIDLTGDSLDEYMSILYARSPKMLPRDENSVFRNGEIGGFTAPTPNTGDLINVLFRDVVNGTDSFRMWFYPNMPKDYTPNPDVEKEIAELVNAGKSAKEVRDELVKRHG